MDFLVENGDGGFRGIPMNAVFADNTGDIGYIMLAGIPNRKDKTPNLGNRVFDGETSAYDWDGLTPVSQLPMIVNPKKGYFATANNRPVSDHSDNDIGANSMSTGRAQRIDEMIKDMIKKNHKITVEDMLAI
jgi:penicillin amidase